MLDINTLKDMKNVFDGFISLDMTEERIYDLEDM